MNKNDSERIVGLLKSAGYLESKIANKADVLIINTCSVRQSAEDRVFGAIKNWQKLKQKNPDLIIAVTGCMPGRDQDGAIKRKLKGVDLFFSIDELLRLPTWLSELNPDIFLLNKKIDKGNDYLNIIPERQNMFQAFITIQTGCNNFCAYCVVPHARGRERNRSVADILQEANEFVKNGGIEITLLGQVVNHYVSPDPDNFDKKNPFAKNDDFAGLLWELNQIEGLKRIHFTAPHPKYFSDFQIEALKLSKLVNYLHLPAQSGDDEILKKMNRGYSSADYLNLIKKIRKTKPDIAIGTDLIIGFCGETDERFNNTLDFYKKCDFDIAYLAIYSNRSGTTANKIFKDDISRQTKKERRNQLQELMEKIAYKKNQKYVGKKIEVMVESCDKGICQGNSREMKFVQFLGDNNLVGRLINVRIFEAKEWILKGEIE